jgi:hypothetical protein
VQVVTPLVTAACIGSSDFCIDTGRRISLELQEGDSLLEDTRRDIRNLFRASLDGPRALLEAVQVRGSVWILFPGLEITLVPN